MASKKEAAEQYLEKHGVADTLSMAIAAAVRAGTDDPFGFIADQLKEKKFSGADARPVVFFVLGGPGAGKGTQCARIVEQLGYTHLSAGDLLRAERASGSAEGTMIDGYITEGKIVPVEVTIRLLLAAIEADDGTHFLIDGFPRNTNNLSGWQATVGDKLRLAGVLMYEVSEEVNPPRPSRTVSDWKGTDTGGKEHIRYNNTEDRSYTRVRRGGLRGTKLPFPMGRVHTSIHRYTNTHMHPIHTHHTYMYCIHAYMHAYFRGEPNARVSSVVYNG